MSSIAPGTYRARAVSWGLGETSTGKEQIVIDFVVMDVEGVEGPHINWYGFFTEKTTKSTIKALRACGWQNDLLTDLDGLDANEVSLVIENETDEEGRTRVVVRWVNAGGSSLSLKAPLTGDKAKAFAARMRQQIAAIDAAEGTRKPKQAPATRPSASRAGGVLPPEPPPHGDSDIPF